MLKMYKILFSVILMFSTLVSVSSYSWMGMWVGLEINLLSIIPLMNSKSIYFSSESSLKYFITQALASVIFLYAVIVMMKQDFIFSSLNNSFLVLVNFSLLTKMGAAPFHFWFPEIMEGLDWFSSFLILTWQKIAPMMIIMFNLSSVSFLYFVIIISIVIGGFMGLNQVSFRKILAYSSINHIGWMIASFMLSFILWLVYFSVYLLISMILVFMFWKFNIYYISQLIGQFKFFELTKFFFNINFLSMGGLPPFLGFLPKWLTLGMMVDCDLILLSIIMVLLTLVTLFYYVRIVLKSLVIMLTSVSFPFSIYWSGLFYTFFNSLNLMGLALFIVLFNFN